MLEKEIRIKYTVFESLEELPREQKALCESAIDALKGSYAPYSKFNVGASVLLEDGTMVQGANQENIAFPSGLCAERTAMFAAGAQYPGVKFKAIALVGAQNGVICPSPATPCGACRQVMAEYQTLAGGPMTVLLVGGRGIYRFSCVDDLLPLIFDSLVVE